MTAKFTVLGNTTLTTSSASVTFSSIPGGYKDLVLVVQAGSTSAGGDAIMMQFNGDTSYSNYFNVFMEGDGSTATSGAWTTNGIANSYNTVHFSSAANGALVWQVMDFTTTDKHKSTLVRSNRASSGVSGAAGRWANTAAITSITLVYGNPAASFSAGSTFRLLGVN